MPRDLPDSDEPSPETDRLSLTELRGLQYGVGGSIMPVAGGWRIIYFSLPDFEQEDGTDFPTLEDAMSAMAGILSIMNSDEEKAKAREELRARLREGHRGRGDEHLVE